MEIDKIIRLFSRLQEIEKAIQIQKMAGTTRIADCNEKLWKMTGHTKREDRYPMDRPYPLLRDLGYSVWRCRIGMRFPDWHYGKSIVEVVSKALESQQHL